jgi:hydroxyacylglutathione hydrolase
LPNVLAPELVVDDALGNSSYVVDIGEGRALVVDPARDPSPYLALAERRGLGISFVAETHLHADFVTGSRELARHGAQVLASAAGGLEFPHRGLGGGDEVDLGGLRLQALATPGHTPEHLAYLLYDGDVPVALFSGGSLIVGAVARTDLISPERTEELTRCLWRSLQETILVLPDELPVFPTHGAGSFCTAAPGGERVTTIGREKATNPLLSAADEDEFVAQFLGGLGTYPSYFRELREVNRRGPAVYGTFPDLATLGLAEARRLVDEGAALVDVRPVRDFAAGHIPGCLSIALRDQFGSWLGWLVERDRPLVFVLGETQDRAELVRQCLTIGYENIAGELAGGMATWETDGLPVSRIPVLPADQVGPGSVLDVRQRVEWEAGHIPEAVHVELGSLTAGTADVPDGPTTVMCGHGERAATAASLLERTGRSDLTVLAGGPDELAAARGEKLAL